MAGREGPDDVDALFREMIAREWPDGTPPADDVEDHEPREPVSPAADPAEPSLFDWVDPNPEEPDEPTYTLDHVVPDDPGDDWRPEPAPLGHRFHGMSTTAAVGAGLLVLSLISIVVMIMVPSARAYGGVIAVGTFAAGLFLLLSRLPRHRPPGDGGAVV